MPQRHDKSDRSKLRHLSQEVHAQEIGVPDFYEETLLDVDGFLTIKSINSIKPSDVQVLKDIVLLRIHDGDLQPKRD